MNGNLVMIGLIFQLFAVISLAPYVNTLKPFDVHHIFGIVLSAIGVLFMLAGLFSKKKRG